jgi:hypothetical protein
MFSQVVFRMIPVRVLTDVVGIGGRHGLNILDHLDRRASHTGEDRFGSRDNNKRSSLFWRSRVRSPIPGDEICSYNGDNQGQKYQRAQHKPAGFNSIDEEISEKESQKSSVQDLHENPIDPFRVTGGQSEGV